MRRRRRSSTPTWSWPRWRGAPTRSPPGRVVRLPPRVPCGGGSWTRRSPSGPARAMRDSSAAAGRGRLGEPGRELVLEAAAGHRADQLLLHLAALEDQQGRDRQDVEAGGGLLVVVDVHLRELDAA